MTTLKGLKPSILHFAFNEVSLIYKNHPRVELFLFQGLSGITVIWKSCLAGFWFLQFCPFLFSENLELSIIIP